MKVGRSRVIEITSFVRKEGPAQDGTPKLLQHCSDPVGTCPSRRATAKPRAARERRILLGSSGARDARLAASDWDVRSQPHTIAAALFFDRRRPGQEATLDGRGWEPESCASDEHTSSRKGSKQSPQLDLWYSGTLHTNMRNSVHGSLP